MLNMKFLLILIAVNSLAGCAGIRHITNENNAKSIPFFEQSDRTTCGAALLSSVMHFYNKPLSEKSILSTYPMSDLEAGYSIGELKFIASESGFQAFAIEGNEVILERMLNKNLPVIIAIRKHIYDDLYMTVLSDHFLVDFMFGDKLDYGHYIAVLEEGENEYTVLDPAKGYGVVHKGWLMERWGSKLNAMLVLVPLKNSVN
ncbi:hypothetical protein BK026_01850 [Alteromonas sp. V450]|uniref:cysteine peptidase family C39 domain-containing protein n=1 Tax=Alteromonas sp. V450 TaxID=1912139 RepID=UPI000919BAFA|nr:cysteine peptidase family C39 domain-containing protein [Alteromonas sp. V450]OJF67629.1 hypothetical protein BK026_01850 [Alteromonas sp. V450]